MKVLPALLLLTQLAVLTAEPISTFLFPDDPEFPSYKDRRIASTRPPVRVHNPRQQKQSRQGGISQTARSSSRFDPNAKKQLTDVTSYRQARRQFRYDRRNPQGVDDDLSLVGVVPPRRGGSRSRPTRPPYSVTSDGVPVVQMGPFVTRHCPKPTGTFPIMRHCEKYLECVFNSGYVRSCPPGTQFDSVSRRCNFPYRVRCIDDFEMYDGPTDLAAAASSRPPLTPSVMEMPTAKLRADGSVSTRCPKPAGMFAIPNRCDAFLNCWGGSGYVQQCAPGTLFNCHTEKCDFPSNVRCVQPDKPQAPMIDISTLARSGVQARSRFGSVMAPPSGQRLRMRGGRTLSQGHVQMYHEGQWNHVCEDGFSRHMADTVCWDMGFKRGSKDVSMKAASQFKLSPNFRMISLKCAGTEEHIYDCQKNTQDTCKVVATSCEQNSLSACPEGYRPFGESCYKVHPTVPKTRAEALETCKGERAELVSIETQEESNFISEMLQYLPNIGCLYTAGVGVTVFNNPVWIWQTTSQTIQFNRWWPGWNRRFEGNAPTTTGTAPQCLVLQNVYPAPPLSRRATVITRPEVAKDMDAGYYWWTAEDCDEKRAFICEAPQNELGCIRSSGKDYRGMAASTESGQPCLHWNDPQIQDLTTQLMLDTSVIGDHNYCRNPDQDERPWCFVSSRDYDYCDIPRCQATETASAADIDRELALDVLGNRGAFDTPGAETNGCGENMFECKPGECKFFSWVCDGEEDCSNGKDESDCHNHVTDYNQTPGSKLVGYDVEKWMFTELNTCARRCSETKDFLCRAFNYRDSDQTCFLLDSNVALSGAAEADVEFVLYELRSEIPSCDSMFVCPSGKCINTSQVCDGRRDCPDEADEQRCRQNVNFDIRLVGGQVPSEGRVEVKAMGRWGVVCDDLLSTVDGDVICRHLGYPLGASEVVTNAGFGSGNGDFLMDDLNCRGDEKRVNDCDFAGWGRSDCTEAEVAGVKCRVSGEPCTSKQWRCGNSKCIDLTYVCDKVDDCGDFSDEEDAQCKLPLEARLVGGTNSSGRVELRYNGIWGTACDDDFDTEDAQVVCRMLGFEGSAVVHENAKYGPGTGQIWIDQLNCQGSEKSVDECHHLPWGSNNCAHEEDVGVSCHASVSPEQAAAVPSATPPLRTMLPEQCGKRVVPDTPIIPLDQNPKIVSGKVTEPGSHPWMVGVRIKAGAETAHWCGAVIVSEWHIISAAHCLLDYPQQVYVLRVGDYDNQVTDPEEQEFTIDRMYPHEEFNKGTYLNHDIIIIRVKPVHGAGIQFGRQVQPVCLAPPHMEYQPGRKCTIAGWGSTGRRAAYARRLRSVVLPLLPISTCTAPHVYGDSKITDGMYCAGYLEGGIDTCQGDSGGPMVCQEDGVGVLYGVTSWGQGCARPNKPGVYTKITSYLPWIARTMEADLSAH